MLDTPLKGRRLAVHCGEPTGQPLPAMGVPAGCMNTTGALELQQVCNEWKEPRCAKN